MSALRLAALLGLLGGLAALPAPPDRPGPAHLHRSARPAVGWVQSADRARGTGWVVDVRRRWLVTCHHVVGEGDGDVTVWFPHPEPGSPRDDRAYYLEHRPRLEREGLVVTGRVIRRDPATDLALVELRALPPGTPALPLAARPARPGDPVQVVGHRHDLDRLWASAPGRVRAAYPRGKGYFSSGKELAKGAPTLLAGALIGEGDSGGPLLDGAGRVVGVAAAVSREAGGSAVCIDVAAVRALLGGGAGEEGGGGEGDAEGARIYREALPGVALVRYPGGGRACGVLVDGPGRLLVTTAAAVGKEETVEVAFSAPGVVAEAAFYLGRPGLLRRRGLLVTGTVLVRDERRGLALVRLESVPVGARALAPVDAPLAPGTPLHLISSPDRVEVLWLYAAAQVRQVGRVLLDREGPAPPLFVLQAPVGDGEGGGPVLDGTGRLVGLLTGKVGPQQQVAYALPAGELLAFLGEQPLARPAGAGALARRGERYLKARQYREAEADFSAVLADSPGADRARVGRAWTRLRRGDPAGAEADGRAGVAGGAGGSAARAVLAAALLALGRGAEAAVEADRAVALDGRDARARAVRALARKSLPDADEGVLLRRDDAFVSAARGEVLLGLGEGAKAVADLSHALALEPGEPAWLRLRGEAHWQANDLPSARADFEAVLAVLPGDPVALLGRARVRAARGEWDGAGADLDAVLRADPGRDEALRERASLRARRGAPRGGAEDYVRLLARPGRLTEGLLAEVDRRVAELCLDQSDPAGAALLAGAVLEGVAPLVKGRPEAGRAAREALASAGKAVDVRERVRLLREGLLAVGARLGEGGR